MIAQYVDDDDGIVFSSNYLREFSQSGYLPNERILKPAEYSLGWKLDARRYAHGDATPNTPWFYSHCVLQYYGRGPIADHDFAEVRREWERTRASFGQRLCVAGVKMLEIAKIVHSHPQQYDNVPFIDVRHSDGSCDYFEFLGFGAGYWFHVFVTDSRHPGDISIVTLSFTPQSDVNAQIPAGNENLLTSSLFTPSE